MYAKGKKKETRKKMKRNTMEIPGEMISVQYVPAKHPKTLWYPYYTERVRWWFLY